MYTKRGTPADHGQTLMYWRGCRCSLCRKANALYCAADRRRRGKSYVRNCNLKCVHGVTLADYRVLLRAQHGVCAACGKPETAHNQYGRLPLSMDHNHRTKHYRGLLCMRCNRTLGMLKESPVLIKRLLAYIKKDPSCVYI